VGPLRFSDLREFVDRTFRQVADKKGLSFDIDLVPNMPPEVETDSKRLQQVLKNLLSNAFKFTESGNVTLTIQPAKSGWGPDHPILNTAPTVVSFAVRDTGIGIPKDKHAIIFEAFQQADGSTARKYGGTGLGLSISREIARLLGGEIRLESEPGKGSTFTLFLPLDYVAPMAEKKPALDRLTSEVPLTLPALVAAQEQDEAAPSASMSRIEIEDDRGTIHPGDRVLLAVTHTPDHAARLRAAAQHAGFKVLVESEADAALDAVANARPTAVAVDLDLPEMAGWLVLDRLKHDPFTRALPVYTVSEGDHRERSLTLGALGHLLAAADPEAAQRALTELRDFVDRKGRSLLIVEDDEVHRRTLADLLGSEDVQTLAVGTAAEALAILAERRFDCVVLDLGLPDMNGTELLHKLNALPHGSPPVIVYTGRELSRQQETELRRVAEAIVVKDAQSPERLLEETSLFLHRSPAQMPETQRKMLERARQKDPLLLGRKVLVVDDDVRNIFALNTLLERYGMKVAFAESAQDGINLLDKEKDIELVLMDVMMPEMDGYQAMRAIRSMEPFAHLPILALTAKAMKGDREKCLEAGASDYITKPVDIDKLLSLLRVWLHAPRGGGAAQKTQRSEAAE
jgi:CheY-like chemotaxis protein/two-component sensor histidine kinase